MPAEKIATLTNGRPAKQSKLLGIGVGIMLSFLLLAAVSTAYFSGIFVSASNDAPTELIIRKVTDASTEIYWATADDTQGIVQYGTNPSELTLISPEVIANKEHAQTLTLLQPSTTYYFNIKIGEKVFDNAGVPWTFATKDVGFTAPPTTDVTGTASDSPVAPEPKTDAPATGTSTCPQTTNCADIKARLGAGCQTSDYIQCLQKNK